MSPHRELCGFFLLMKPSPSRSVSASRNVFLASVLVISSCLPSFDVSFTKIVSTFRYRDDCYVSEEELSRTRQSSAKVISAAGGTGCIH